MSRATLREALNVLESEGLVRLRRGPGGGAIVTAPDGLAIMRSLESLLRFEGTTMEQVMEVRLVVDPLAGRLAAIHAGADDVERIGASVERQRRPEVIGAHEPWFEENLYFHWAIAAASHNPLVRVLSESLHNIVLTGGLPIDFETSERRRSVDDHAAIHAAISAHDPDGAATRLRSTSSAASTCRQVHLNDRSPVGTLDGKVAIVTGAAQGIGAAYARHLASCGATVVLADLDEKSATGNAEKLVADGASAAGAPASTSPTPTSAKRSPTTSPPAPAASTCSSTTPRSTRTSVRHRPTRSRSTCGAASWTSTSTGCTSCAGPSSRT